MSVFGMSNFVRSCLKCSAIRLRNCKYRIFPTSSHLLPKRCHSSSTSKVSNLADINLSEDFDYENESPYSNIDLEAISGGDANKLKALKVLQLEIDLMRQQGEKVPVHLTARRWKELLPLPNDDRLKYLQHLWVLELKTKHTKEMAKEKTELYLEFKAKQKKADPKCLTTSSPIEYSLTETTLFHRIYETTINRWYNYKLLQAEWLGPKIIVDCSYEPFMNFKSMCMCAKQMVVMWAGNRDNSNPYDLIFCNVNKQGALWKKFTTQLPSANEADGPVHFTAKHYLELFPKNQLVYLTPHCNVILETFDPNDIYIIGAFVDTNYCQPVSLAKAKKDGLRMAKLPLDKYLRWVTGHKSLTLYQVLAIFNDLKDGQSWQQALQHVPPRNIGDRTLCEEDGSDKLNPLSAETIRENYRKNLVYDLLLKQK